MNLLGMMIFLNSLIKKISGTRQFPIFLNKNKEVLDIFWSDEKFDKLYFVLIEKKHKIFGTSE